MFEVTGRSAPKSILVCPLALPTAVSIGALVVEMRMHALLALMLAVSAHAQNLYPDPGFELTGVQGMARSGACAGFLEVGQEVHWATIGGELGVEPYATYRASAWVRGGSEVGSALALYVYQWDSYVWAFSAQVHVPSEDEWTQVAVEFCVPYSTVWLYPLAFLDAARGKAWVDDIVVERIATPEETVARLRGKTTLAPDDARLLARWYVAHDDFESAEGLLGATDDPGVRADIACVIARAARDEVLAAAMLAEMIHEGAPSLHDGHRRIAEVAGRLAPETVLAALRQRFAAKGTGATALRHLAAALRTVVSGRTGPELVATREARTRGLRNLATEIEAVSTGDPEREAAARTVREEVTAMVAETASLRAQIGSCQLVIGGEAVTPATHAIVIPSEPTPQESLAARDLQVHLEKVTGKKIPLLTAGDAGGRRWILVGKVWLTDSLGVTVDYDALGVEGIRIKSVGPHLILTGNQRGVLYAVYTFLEDYVGCRWFTPDCSTWPTAGTIYVRDLDVTYIPPLEYRATDYPNSRPAGFAVRNKLNGNLVDATEEWGSRVSYRGFVHTFNALVPPEQYFDTHPEYFSEVNGQRIRDYTQLCLTNPEVLRIATETVRRWIRESPEATIISVSQNDWHNYCTCPECTELAELEGAQSGPLLHFVNAIADAIAEEHPGIIIDTLAYQYTRKPPLHVRPRPNVAVRLCTIECEFNRPLETSPFNASFVEDIRGWNAICDRLHIWDYVINYAHCVQPFPNLHVLQPNIRFFIANGVTGIYEEANYFSRGGEFAELRTYLMAKLLWNPDFDVERGLEEFLAAYYGPAAPRIRAYIDDIHRLAVSDPDYHMSIYVPPRAPFQMAEALQRYKQLFDEAEQLVADDPIRLHRVEVARLPIIYTEIAQNADPRYRLAPHALVPIGEVDLKSLIDRFERIARAEGLTSVSEGGWGNLDAWLERVRAGAGERPVSRIKGGGLEAVVVPSVGGRILSLRRLADSRELLQLVERGGGLDPTVGGYKEFSERGYQSPGWIEPFEVVSATPNAMSLRARLPNGLQMDRAYSLDVDGPTLHIVSTVTNASSEPRTACIRAHPCLRLADADTARARLGPPGAQEIALGYQGDADAERWFRGPDRPPGEWTLLDPAANVAVTSRFSLDEVEVCYLNWHGPDQRANLELWTPEKRLGPNESITLSQSFVVGTP